MRDTFSVELFIAAIFLFDSLAYLEGRPASFAKLEVMSQEWSWAVAKNLVLSRARGWITIRALSLTNSVI